MLSSSRRTPNGFTLIEFLVVLAIIGILIALLLPAVRNAHPHRERSQCQNNLKVIGLALHNYHDTYGSFPPAYTVDESGTRLHSWRTLILPYLEQQPLYDQIDLTKPWNDPANVAVFKTARVPTYVCPSTDLKDSQTTYVAVVGPETCFPDAGSRRLSDITDGPSDTLLVFETDHAHAVLWMEPVDADADGFFDFGRDTEQELAHTGGTHVLLGDGAARFISRELPTATRRALLTVAEADDVGEF
jgi:prepilin-type N-terminal cleavage/methylation domain-containing protein